MVSESASTPKNFSVRPEQSREPKIISLCLFFTNIYLFIYLEAELHTEKVRDREALYSLVHSPEAAMAGPVLVKPRSLELPLGLPYECRGPGTWAVL